MTSEGILSSHGTFYMFSSCPSSSSHPILLIHGLGGFHKVWQSIQTFFSAQRYNVLSYDVIGRGHSKPPSNDTYDATQHLAQVTLLLDEVESKYSITPKRWHVIGHSMGGGIAGLVGAHLAQRVASVTLMAPVGLMNSTLIRLVRNLSCIHGYLKRRMTSQSELRNDVKRDFCNQTGEYLQRQQEQFNLLVEMQKTCPTLGHAKAKSVVEFPMNEMKADIEKLSQQNLNVYVIWGKHDAAVPFSPSYENWKSILTNSDAKCTYCDHVLEHAGHGFHWEFPDQAQQLLNEFLSNVEAKLAETK